MDIKNLKVLVACESSGTVRDAFNRLGANAWSCDVLPSSGQHIQCDAREILFADTWDLMIAHPPCTYLAASGMHWTYRGMRDPKLTDDALKFVRLLLDAPIRHIAIENPVGRIGTAIRKANQYIHPYQFGDDISKRTGLWLKNLPPLRPTDFIPAARYACCGEWQESTNCHHCGKPTKPRWGNQTPRGMDATPPSKLRWQKRSKTHQGIADAMAQQWTQHILETQS
jgi:hypothetical protein